MASWMGNTLDLLWHNALAAIFPALIVALLCYCVRCRPVTRHALWLMVLILFILPPVSNTWHLHIREWWPAPRAQSVLATSGQPNVSLCAPAADLAPLNHSLISVGRKIKYVKPEGQLRFSQRATSPAAGGWEQAAAIIQNFYKTPPRTGVGADKSALSRGTGKDSARRFDHHPSTHPDNLCCKDSKCVCHAGDQQRRHDPALAASPAAENKLTQFADNLLAICGQFLTAFNKPVLADVAVTTDAVGPPSLETLSQTPSLLSDTPPAPLVQIEDTPECLPSPTPPGVLQSQLSTARDWAMEVVAAVRAALVRLPKMPAGIWIMGTLGLLFLHVVRTAAFRRVIRNSCAAPPSVVTLVNDCAASLKMNSTPEIRMIDGPWSPMVIGLLQYRLLIPVDLWSQLDDVGRRAILLHELAHLRRRDLWVRRLEALVTMLCWWHPLVWYARHRVREEAELCCDAWVTWLLPRERRAYATALLRAQQFIRNHSAEAPMGIGVVSGRARRFARRLTMVMTNQNRPGLSWPGFAAALILAMAGWLAAPVWACPDDEAPKHKHPRTDDQGNATPEAEAPLTVLPPMTAMGVPTPPPAPPAMTAPVAGVAWTVAPHPAIAPTVPVMPLMTAGQAAWGQDDRELESRMRRLEEQIRRLEQTLDRMGGQPGSGQGAPRPRSAGPGQSFGMGQGLGGMLFASPPADGPKIARLYRLSKGKLDALVALMSRDDVPVMISRKDHGIEVQATESQHEIIRAFIDVIEPGAGQSGFMRQPSQPRQPMPPQTPRPGSRNRAGSARGETRQKILQELNSAHAKGQQDTARAIDEEIRTLNRAAEQVERESEKIREKAEQLREKAEQMREKAQESRSSADEIREEAGNEEKVTTLNDKARTMEEAASALEQQAGEMEAQAGDVEAHNGEIEAQVAALESQQEQEQEAAEAAEEAAEGAAAEAEEADEAAPVAEASDNSEGKDWYDRGYAFYSDKEYAKAIDAFNKSSEMEHRKAEALYNIACCYSLSGQTEKAMEYLKIAWDAGFTNKSHIETDSDLDKIRDSERYKEFLQSHE
jgi:beta-lactamase regulating signal transducer with metallopeptidase domain/tetratricopeptide (TPR) repeat protein